MLELLLLQQSKEIWVAKNVLIFFENSNLRNFLVSPLLILNKKRIVLILAMYENTAPALHCKSQFFFHGVTCDNNVIKCQLKQNHISVTA